MFRTKFVFQLWRCWSPFKTLLTNDLGTFPLVVTFWLCFSLATRILCLAGIFGKLFDHWKTAQKSLTSKPQQSKLVKEEIVKLTACDVRILQRLLWLVLVEHVIQQMNKHRFVRFIYYFPTNESFNIVNVCQIFDILSVIKWYYHVFRRRNHVSVLHSSYPYWVKTVKIQNTRIHVLVSDWLARRGWKGERVFSGLGGGRACKMRVAFRWLMFNKFCCNIL